MQKNPSFQSIKVVDAKKFRAQLMKFWNLILIFSLLTFHFEKKIELKRQ